MYKDLLFGSCQCGCGQPTNRAVQGRTECGVSKGDHYRFVVGHRANRVLPLEMGMCQLKLVDDDKPCYVIPLTKGFTALLDEADIALVLGISWRVNISTQCATTRYAYSGQARNGTQISMHRLITGCLGHLVVDHIDRNGLDNRRKNLREVTCVENQQNLAKQKRNVTGFKGVFAVPTRSKIRPWVARIGLQKKSVHLGQYASPEEAAIAYDNAARLHFGSQAALNFPLQGEYGCVSQGGA